MARTANSQLVTGVVQLVLGGAWGAAFLWVLGMYGWQSTFTIWSVVAFVLVVLAVNLSELRARIAILEKRSDEGK